MFLNLMIRLRMLVAEIKEESGQALVEYALIIALIAVAVMATLTLLGTGIDKQFTAIKDAIANA